ncbi:putative tail fiber protein [Aeromonas phage ACP1]
MIFTQNPIGSSATEDLQDNAISFDYAMNSPAALWQDRFGKQHKTVQQALKDVGFKPAGFDFVSGGTLGIGDRDKCVFYPTDGYWYSWNGKLPYVVQANSSPTPGGKKGWKVVEKNSSYIGVSSVEEIKSGLFNIGSFLFLSDRAGALFEVVKGGVPDGYGILDASNGNTAVLYPNQKMFIEYFGAKSGKESSLAINAAFAYCTNKEINGLPGSVYIHNKQLNLKGSLLAAKSIFKPTGLNMQTELNAAIYCDRPAKIITNLDGRECDNLQYGLFTDVGLVVSSDKVMIDCVVTDIKNNTDTEQCIGVALYKSSSSVINQNITASINAHVSDIMAKSNGTIGDSGGTARGILVAFNDAASTPNVSISGTVKNVSSGGIDPAEDSDGIQLFHGGYTNIDNRSKFNINNVKVSGVKKRGIKVQAPNCSVSNSLIDGTNCLASLETYGVNTVINDVTIKNATGIGVTSSAANTKIVNSSIETIGNAAPIKFYGGSDFFKVSNTEIRIKGNIPDVINYGGIEVENSRWGSITNTSVYSLTGTGAGLVVVSGNIETLSINNFKIINTGNGIVSLAATGIIVIDGGSEITCTAVGLFKSTHDALIFDMSGGYITSSGIPILTSSSTSSGVVKIKSVRLKTTGGTYGALVSNDSIFIDTLVEKDGDKAAGAGLSSNNYRVSGCRVSNFDIGISYDYSTTAEIYNNLTINCDKPYSKTNYTEFVEHNNFSR